VLNVEGPGFIPQMREKERERERERDGKEGRGKGIKNKKEIVKVQCLENTFSFLIGIQVQGQEMGAALERSKGIGREGSSI
jgi:hypothetical protein